MCWDHGIISGADGVSAACGGDCVVVHRNIWISREYLQGISVLKRKQARKLCWFHTSFVVHVNI